MALLLLMAGACNSVQTGSASEAGGCGLQMSHLYTDGMVLQRDVRLVIKGEAAAGEKVTVRLEGPFRTVTRRARASAEGVWEVKMPSLKAATGLTLTISGRDKSYVYDDVAAGDIWVCSGQSNMFFRVFEGTDIGETPADPDLRLFNMRPRGYVNNERWTDEQIASVQALDFYHPTSWQACDGQNMADFSAVGYHFGKMLRDSLDVPIGLICNAIGGSPTEAWVGRSFLEEGYPEILEEWFGNELLNQWCREMGMINIGYPETGATRHPFEPCYLFESAIAPMGGFPVKGVIWYQGESNDYDIPMHERLFGLLVDSWRDNWDNPELPFHFVQLSSLYRDTWPAFRDSQRRLADAIPHCEMAVSSDLGDSLDVHPRQKRPVGERLARLALHHDYGMNLVPCGPVLKEAVWNGEQTVLSFEHADGLTTADAQALRCFEVASEDEVYVPAEAVISDGKVILTSEIRSPWYVRYAWQPYTRANLVNGDGLPASTFCAPVSR